MAKAKVKETEEEQSKLEKLKEAMEKKYGKGTIISGTTRPIFDVVSTGSVVLDKATDCGGIPIGKLIEIFGPESSGKSTLCLHIIAEFQKQGKKCLLADYEYSFDKRYAKEIGVDTDALIITQPDTMENGWNIIYEYIKSGEIGLVVLDSHTAMVPKARLDGEIGDAKMAPEARINSDALKKIKPELERNNCTILGVSQLRSQIGGMGKTGDKPTGGNSWKFYSDMRIKVYKKLDRDNHANDTFAEVIKNKCGKPFGQAQVQIGWGIGIDKVQEIIDICLQLKTIKKAGSWYSLADETKIGQGSNSVKEFFADNPDVYEEMKTEAITNYLNAEMKTVKVEEGKEEELPVDAIIE